MPKYRSREIYDVYQWLGDRDTLFTWWDTYDGHHRDTIMVSDGQLYVLDCLTMRTPWSLGTYLMLDSNGRLTCLPAQLFALEYERVSS